MPKILIIEDEHNLARFLELELKHEGYDVTVKSDGLNGLEKALDEDFDCILLDLMLPGLNGLEVCRKIRREKETPIIMITAKDATYDKVIGLDYGADDYIVKPFEIEELLARLRVIIRRHSSSSLSNTIDAHGITIDLSAYKVIIEDIEVDLTKTEFELLKLLIENENVVLRRETILDKIWGYDNEVETNVVDVYIRYLRNKLKPFKLEKII